MQDNCEVHAKKYIFLSTKLSFIGHEKFHLFVLPLLLLREFSGFQINLYNLYICTNTLFMLY